MSAKLHFKPKMSKLVELLLYLSHKKQRIDHYKACKLVYLADWTHLNRYGRPIVGDHPVAMQWGPVATKSLDLLKQHATAMQDAGIKELPFETSQLDKIVYIETPKRSVNHDVFSRSDLLVFDEVVEKYGNLEFRELHDITSRHFAYSNAWNKKSADKKSAPMSFDDMLEETAAKAEYIDEISVVSEKM